jgi:hypothetical protein
MGQLGLGLACALRSEVRNAQPVAEELFLDAEAHELFVGAQRLEAYLNGNDMGWVLRLASLLKGFDYSAYVQAISPTGGARCIRA